MLLSQAGYSFDRLVWQFCQTDQPDQPDQLKDRKRGNAAPEAVGRSDQTRPLEMINLEGIK